MPLGLRTSIFCDWEGPIEQRKGLRRNKNRPPWNTRSRRIRKEMHERERGSGCCVVLCGHTREDEGKGKNSEEVSWARLLGR